MERRPIVAVLLALTALVVLVPAVVQLFRKEYRPGQVWPHLLVAAGMLVVAGGYGLAEGRPQAYLAGAGFVTALAGMIALQRHG